MISGAVAKATGSMPLLKRLNFYFLLNIFTSGIRLVFMLDKIKHAMKHRVGQQGGKYT